MNKIILRRLIRFIGFFSISFALIGFFPAIGDIFTFFYYKDIVINHDKYNKKKIVIDSLFYTNMDGNDNPRVDGYSKELNNYKTIILFDKKTKQDNFSIDKNGSLKGFVWYREGIDFAIPANKQDKAFPLKGYIYKNLKIPILWLFAIILTFITFKISKYNKIFKTNRNEENN